MAEDVFEDVKSSPSSRSERLVFCFLGPFWGVMGVLAVIGGLHAIQIAPSVDWSAAGFAEAVRIYLTALWRCLTGVCLCLVGFGQLMQGIAPSRLARLIGILLSKRVIALTVGSVLIWWSVVLFMMGIEAFHTGDLDALGIRRGHSVLMIVRFYVHMAALLLLAASLGLMGIGACVRGVAPRRIFGITTIAVVAGVVGLLITALLGALSILLYLSRVLVGT